MLEVATAIAANAAEQDAVLPDRSHGSPAAAPDRPRELLVMGGCHVAGCGVGGSAGFAEHLTARQGRFAEYKVSVIADVNARRATDILDDMPLSVAVDHVVLQVGMREAISGSRLRPVRVTLA